MQVSFLDTHRQDTISAVNDLQRGGGRVEILSFAPDASGKLRGYISA
jgi:hypothetical protein